MENSEKNDLAGSILMSGFHHIIEWGNNWLTLQRLLFRKKDRIFINIEIMMLVVLAVCIALLFTIHLFPYWLGYIICILLAQRVIEFIIVYSRNFILNKGLIFSHFKNQARLSEWLILMFSISITQVVFVFSVWYRFISYFVPGSFSSKLSAFDSLYYSIVTFTTIGYGDIAPLSDLTKGLSVAQSFLIFFTLFIVINGLISIHFVRPGRRQEDQ